MIQIWVAEFEKNPFFVRFLRGGKPGASFAAGQRGARGTPVRRRKTAASARPTAVSDSRALCGLVGVVGAVSVARVVARGRLVGAASPPMAVARDVSALQARDNFDLFALSVACACWGRMAHDFCSPRVVL